jgi:hypothetical protein
MVNFYPLLLDKRRDGHESKPGSTKVYLSARTIVTLLVVPVVLSHFAGRLLSRRWGFAPGATRETSAPYTVWPEGECRRVDDISIDFSVGLTTLRESCIGYGTAASRADESTTKASAVFYESLVHLPMFTHANPVRVAVIVDSFDNDEEAVVSEVLKHATVKQVEVFGAKTCSSDIDPRVVRICSNPGDAVSDVLLHRTAEEKNPYDVILWSNHR